MTEKVAVGGCAYIVFMDQKNFFCVENFLQKFLGKFLHGPPHQLCPSKHENFCDAFFVDIINLAQPNIFVTRFSWTSSTLLNQTFL
jgi:hypothetical protein